MKTRCLVCLLLLVAGCSPEPEFEGKSLSYWRRDLQSTDALGRSRAAYAMAAMGTKARAAIPELIKLLSDQSHIVRFEAARALGEMGPVAKNALPNLTKLLHDKDADVRRAARKSIENIDPQRSTSTDK